MIVLILGALGLANMWMAIFADTGVLIMAVMNAMRALFVKRSDSIILQGSVKNENFISSQIHFISAVS